MKTVIPVTVVIPTLNEGTNIAECLNSISNVMEIIVVDSGSSDQTCDIAIACGASVISFVWNGRFPKKRNWVLRNYAFKTKWVLFLDADERLTPLFLEELRFAVAKDDVSGYWIKYNNHFMGRQLRYGVPQRKLSLFRVGMGEYEKVDEDRWSRLDMEVHEHPQVVGFISEMSARVDHVEPNGLSRYVMKHLDYAEWESSRYISGLTSDGRKAMTFRQRIKYACIRSPFFALAYFVFTYCARGGFLDGLAGFHYALLKAWYFYLVSLKIRELSNVAHRVPQLGHE